jgi:hypothetical protein
MIELFVQRRIPSLIHRSSWRYGDCCVVRDVCWDSEPDPDRERSYVFCDVLERLVFFLCFAVVVLARESPCEELLTWVGTAKNFPVIAMASQPFDQLSGDRIVD